MWEIQTGLHKPEGVTKQRLTKSADNSAPVCFPNCASICLGARVSFDLPLAIIIGVGARPQPRGGVTEGARSGQSSPVTFSSRLGASTRNRLGMFRRRATGFLRRRKILPGPWPLSSPPEPANVGGREVMFDLRGG